MPVIVRSLLVEDLADHLDAVERVYALAFDEDAATSRRFRNRLATEARSKPGFQFHLASEQDEAVGFIYGYQVQPSDWWAHLIRPAMAEANVAYWLDDAFELVEFAVVPNRQGRGIGAALHDALFANVTEPRALLGTDPPPTPAYRFYARRGWQVLLPDWRHSPDDADSLIVMGLDRQTL